MKKNYKAHEGSITSTTFTLDGDKILSVGQDSKIRLWNVLTGENEFVDYPHVKSLNHFGPNICISNNNELLYYPRDDDIYVYELKTGIVVNKLEGHFDKVTYLQFHPQIPEMYSASRDRQINIWTPQLTDPYQELSESSDWDSEDIS